MRFSLDTLEPKPAAAVSRESQIRFSLLAKKGFKKSTDRATAAAARCIGLQTIWSIQVLQHECWASSLAWPLLGLYLVRDILRLFYIYFLNFFLQKYIFGFRFYSSIPLPSGRGAAVGLPPKLL